MALKAIYMYLQTDVLIMFRNNNLTLNVKNYDQHSIKQTFDSTDFDDKT